MNSIEQTFFDGQYSKQRNLDVWMDAVFFDRTKTHK